MYEIFSRLPEDTPFFCSICRPSETRHVDLIMVEMLDGMKDVLESVTTARGDKQAEVSESAAEVEAGEKTTATAGMRDSRLT